DCYNSSPASLLDAARCFDRLGAAAGPRLWVLGGMAQDGNPAPGLEMLMDRLKTFRTNDEFLAEVAKTPGV
ncbi:MAG: hypothetical protein EBS48_05435, partial [Actinobacteria bacterium]|nr:hypothetical protein [Actinomycetota bacterium]